VSIDGLTLDGATKGKGVHGVWLNKPDYGKQEDFFKIERVDIRDFTGDGIRLERAWGFYVRSSLVTHNAGDGISIEGWDGFLMDNIVAGNRGAGIAARKENASCTLTGNRIEWNHQEGILVVGGNSYNITGNFFDRAGTSGLAITDGRQITITGNVLRRSGSLVRAGGNDSSNIRLERARGLTCCGNTMEAGRNDDGKGVLTPSFAIVAKGLQNCAISTNALDNAAVQQLVLDLGGHLEGVVIKDNPGCLKPT
jgi:hypothetical protein